MVITLVADSKTTERQPRKCGSCNKIGHDVRNCPELSIEQKEALKNQRKKKAGRENNMAEPKRGRTGPEIEKKTTDKDDEVVEEDEDKEGILERNNLNPFVDGAGGDAEEQDEAKDDSIVDRSLLGEFKNIPTPPVIGLVGGSRSGSIDRELPHYSGHISGPRLTEIGISSAGKMTACGVFKLLFSDKICERFIVETNNYARHIDKKDWVDMSLHEFHCFIAIVLYMGVVNIGERRAYWSKGIFEQSFISEVDMTCRRFDDIVSCLHFVDRTHLSSVQLALKRKENPFYAVDDFISMLTENYKRYYRLGRMFDVDEMSIYFKGRHICRCYNPNKPEKWHFKAFALNCSSTGYCWDLYLYHGAAEVRPPGRSATAYPITKLTADPILHHKNHIIAMDNWYTSIEVVLYLADKGIHVVGTVKTNRKGLPKSGILKKTGIDKKNRGFYHTFRAQILAKPDWFVYFHAWMDNKPVSLLSTFQVSSQMCSRKTFDWTGAFIHLQVPRPGVVGIYNHAMGGTDLCDQIGSYIRTTLRANKWPVRIFTHFINLTVSNAHVLYRGIKDRGSYSVIDFITDLIPGLIAYDESHVHAPIPDLSCDVATDISPDINPRTARRHSWYNNPTHIDIRKNTQLPHYLEAGHSRSWCRYCNVRKVQTACITCQAALCLPTKGEGDASCFRMFHSEH